MASKQCVDGTQAQTMECVTVDTDLPGYILSKKYVAVPTRGHALCA